MWKKSECYQFKELILPFSQQFIKMDLKNLKGPNWYEVTEEQKLDG